jgi:hypothetical protein
MAGCRAHRARPRASPARDQPAADGAGRDRQPEQEQDASPPRGRALDRLTIVPRPPAGRPRRGHDLVRHPDRAANRRDSHRHDGSMHGPGRRLVRRRARRARDGRSRRGTLAPASLDRPASTPLPGTPRRVRTRRRTRTRRRDRTPSRRGPGRRSSPSRRIRRRHDAYRARLGDALAGRQERQRIDVPVRFRGNAHTQVHVRLRMLTLAAGADGADDVALGDWRADPHTSGAKVHERDRVTICGADRQRHSGSGNHPDEADRARRRRSHLGAARGADVDASMLSAQVRVVVGPEALQDGSVDRPGPRIRFRGGGERAQPGEEQHAQPSVASFENHGSARYQGGPLLSTVATRRSGRACCGECR